MSFNVSMTSLDGLRGVHSAVAKSSAYNIYLCNEINFGVPACVCVLFYVCDVTICPAHMQARREKAAYKRDLWRGAIVAECSRPGDKPTQGRAPRDVQWHARKLKRDLAEERSKQAHDKEYRRTKKARRQREKTHGFADTCLCDVELYHHHRLTQNQHISRDESDALTFRWIEFEQAYKSRESGLRRYLSLMPPTGFARISRCVIPSIANTGGS